MKNSKILLVLATIASTAALAGCQQKATTAVEKAIADAETLSQEDLFKKAAEELGDSGQLKILATTSRGGKDAVKNAFIAKLQKYNANITAPLKYDTTVDGAIYTSLLSEIESGVTDGYSAAIVQDGYQLQTKGLDTKYFKNYIPKEWKEGAGVDVSGSSNPMTLQYNFKTWMYNNKNNDMTIDNVWDVTASKYKGKIDTMNPNNENVNMDWLIQLTQKDQVASLKAAYEASTNSSDIKIADYSKYGDKSYAYAFIDGFLHGFYDHILLSITDDGAGMDPEKLKEIAVSRGVLDADTAARMSDTEAFNLIFAPGFSTKQQISDISGRGVGMDVVKTSITQLNGTINIQSAKGTGTRIEIKVPLTLAILPTLMVEIGQQTFALPLSSVNEIFYLNLATSKMVDGQLTIIVRDKAIPLFFLQEWLIRGGRGNRTESGHVVIVQVGQKQIGFVVDNLIGQEEVVIKPLDNLLHGTPGMAGATITSDGGIALILDIPGLLKHYARRR